MGGRMSIWAKEWAYEQVTGSPGRKAVLVALAEFADPEGICHPGQKLIAEMTEMGYSTVRKHLKDLEEKCELIEREERFRKDRGQSTYEYRLLAPPERLKPHVPSRQGGCSDSAGGMPTESRGGAEIEHPNIDIEPSVEPSSSLRSEGETPSARHYVQKLADLIRDTGIPAPPNYKRNLGNALKRELKAGRDPTTIDAAIQRIGERWAVIQLDLPTAIGDVLRPPLRAVPGGKSRSAAQESSEYEKAWAW